MGKNLRRRKLDMHGEEKSRNTSKRMFGKYPKMIKTKENIGERKENIEERKENLCVNRTIT